MGAGKKKEGTEALGAIRDYMRRDTYGNSLVQDVERYIGSLRREKADLKLVIENLEAKAYGLQEATKAAVKSAGDHEEARRKAEAEAYRISNEAREAMVKLAEAEKTITMFHALLEDDPKPDDSTIPKDIGQKVRALQRVVRKRIPKPPQPRGKLCEESPLMFSIWDFLSEFSNDEFLTLGMFTAFAATMMRTVGFTRRSRISDSDTVIRFGTKRERERFSPGDELSESTMVASINWFRRWIDWRPTKLEKACDPKNVLRGAIPRGTISGER